MVFIKTPPPIYEVAQMKVNGAVQVYALMFESAFKEKQYDIRGRAKGRSWGDLRDTGGRSEWSVKGLADCLRLGKVTVSNAIDALLDQGFISFDGFISTRNGSPKRIYRVTPVDQLEAKRKALEILGAPSLRKPKPPKAPDLKADRSFLDFIDVPNTEEIVFDDW